MSLSGSGHALWWNHKYGEFSTKLIEDDLFTTFMIIIHNRNTYFNFGWHGVFIDGNKKSIRRGIRFFNKYPHPWFYKPAFICSKVTREKRAG